jgi:hypothetical protein
LYGALVFTVCAQSALSGLSLIIVGLAGHHDCGAAAVFEEKAVTALLESRSWRCPGDAFRHVTKWMACGTRDVSRGAQLSIRAVRNPVGYAARTTARVLRVERRRRRRRAQRLAAAGWRLPTRPYLLLRFYVGRQRDQHAATLPPRLRPAAAHRDR